MEYAEALASMNPSGLDNVNINTKIKYDLLNILVNKDRVKSFFCDKMYAKYPNSYSYSMKLCSIFNNYKSTKKVSSKQIKNLEEYFKDSHQDKKYLLTAVKDL